MGQETLLGYIDFMYSREGIDSKGLVSEVTAVNGEGTTVQNVDYFTQRYLIWTIVWQVLN